MDTGKLAAAFGAKFEQVLALSAAGESDPVEVKRRSMEALGITDAALHRGAMTAVLDLGIGGDDDLAFLFVIAFAMGEGCGLRRVKLTLSDPRARGREIDVLDALIRGADIEDANRQAVASPVEGPSGKVVRFLRRD